MSGSVLDTAIAAVEALARVDPGTRDGAGLKRLVLGMDRLRQLVQATRARALVRFEDSGAWADDGAYNAANWLVTHTGTSRADARSQVRLAKQLQRMPVAREAFETGAITAAHARLLARCVTPRTRQAFDEQEQFLVDKATELPADEFATVVQVWLEHFDQDGPQPADESNTFFMSRTLDGRLKGTFDLGPELAAPVEAAIEEKTQELFHRERRNAEADPADPGLYRSAANRRAHALAELIEQGAAAGDNPGRRRPAFYVTIDPHTFSGEDAGPDAVHLLDNGHVVPMSLVALWRCDCVAARAVLSGEGAVLDLGRLQRTASNDQRRALTVRDRGCAVPGCDRPASWCDAHHVAWWERDHGPTDIDNLVLLCRHHHRRIHTRHLTVRIVDGTAKFWRADGRPLTLPAPRGHPPRARAA